MTSDSSFVFSCEDCSSGFEKRMDYNRHRKKHDRPYPCYLCHKTFGLKTGLQRHRSTHRATSVKFKCMIPGCKPLVTARKDYLRKHMRDVHSGQYTGKDLQELYNQAVNTAKVSNADEKGLELLCASREGDQEKVRLLISLNASTDVSDDQGLTALHLACKMGNIGITDLLIDKGADVDAESREGDSPLACASREGHILVVKILLENGAAVDVGVCSEDTPLDCAVRAGYTSIVKLLLENGASTKWNNGKRYYSEPPLICAIEKGYLSIAELLLENGTIQDLQGTYSGSPLHIAIEEGHLSIAKLLLKKGAEMDRYHYMGSILSYAARYEMIPTMELLLAHGADVDGVRWWTPLEQAAVAGKLENVKILLDHGADLKGREKGPLCYAVEKGHFDVVKLLLDRGADPMAISDSRAAFSVNRLRRGGTSKRILQLLEEAYSKNLLQEGTSSHPVSP